ncbi:MAG: hypothetical protein KDA87_20125, partial [Planctomycetales bacterium]|nr:hypothetical protein [Planctomycetales bacterium]
KVMIGGSTTSFTIEITAGPNAVQGTYSPAVYALIKEPNGQQAYTHDHSFQVNIENAAAADPIDNFASLQFSNLQDTSPMYTNGMANVQQSFAVYDSNQNGIIDSEAGYDNTPFPGFPVAGGGANVGRAYAMPYEERANLVVAAQYGPFEWVAVHFRIRDDGNVVPIQALIGDFTTGEIMIQDLAGWTYDVSGSLPANGQNGHFSGSISFDPFYYDGVANYILGNHVEFAFDVALESDF